MDLVRHDIVCNPNWLNFHRSCWAVENPLVRLFIVSMWRHLAPDVWYWRVTTPTPMLKYEFVTFTLSCFIGSAYCIDCLNVLQMSIWNRSHGASEVSWGWWDFKCTNLGDNRGLEWLPFILPFTWPRSIVFDLSTNTCSIFYLLYSQIFFLLLPPEIRTRAGKYGFHGTDTIHERQQNATWYFLVETKAPSSIKHAVHFMMSFWYIQSGCLFHDVIL